MEIVPYRSGGAVIVPDEADHGDMGAAVPADGSRSVTGDPGGLTDAQHFANFESQLSAAFVQRGILNWDLSSVVAREARDLYRVVGDDTSDNVFELLGPFAQRLVRAGVTEPLAVGAAIEVAAGYLWEMLLAETGGSEERDLRDYQQARVALKAQWGANYRATVRAIREFVNTKLPPSLADTIWQGRDSDGRCLANSVDVMLWLAGLAQGLSAGDIYGTRAEVQREIAQIERFMRTNRADYNRDSAVQSRYLDLIRLRDGVE